MLSRLKRHLSHRFRALVTKGSFPSSLAPHAPSLQKTVDLFKDEWAAELPFEGIKTGVHAALFNDDRIRWFLDYLNAKGGLSGKTVLELGPLEGAHSAMLSAAGAQQVLGIESNASAFMRCLLVKELLSLDRCKFLWGDFVQWLKEPGPNFDAGLACGVLYHMRDPQDVLSALRRRVDGPVFLWTQYWSPEIQTKYPGMLKNFSTTRRVVLANGAEIELHRHNYGSTVFRKGFFGGNSTYSEWLELDGLLSALENAGWTVVDRMDAPTPYGPALSCILEPRT